MRQALATCEAGTARWVEDWDVVAESGWRARADRRQSGHSFVDPIADRDDFVVCAADKHLRCPRGRAFLTVRQDRIPELVPRNANWRAADDPCGRYVGGPLTLADNGRSVRTVDGMALLDRRRHVARSDRRLAAGRCTRSHPRQGSSARGASRAQPTGSSIGRRAGRRHGRGPRGARAGARQGWGAHRRRSAVVPLYTTPDDIDRAVEVLAPLGAHRVTPGVLHGPR